MSGLPRELIRWIQSLDLTWSVKNAKWDLSNGYLVAEIFSWYFPQDIEMHMFHNATALNQKLCNWQLLRKIMKKHKLDIPEDVIDATIHCKEGAAKVLIQMLYELLTNRMLRVVPVETDVDFTDQAYQSQLPLHARSTTINAIRNNFKVTEQMVVLNELDHKQKVQVILERHSKNRANERIEYPERFSRKKTVGEMALRKPPTDEQGRDDLEENVVEDMNYPIDFSATNGGRDVTMVISSADGKRSANSVLLDNVNTQPENGSKNPSRHSSAVSFHEIQVKQSSLGNFSPNPNENEAMQPRCH